MRAPSASDKVVILDRDGTVVIDRGYLSDPAGLEFEPGAMEGLRRLYAQGYRLIVVTNQSGVGRGFFAMERVLAMNERLNVMVEAAGAKLAGIYVCPHTPEAGCACRKPAQGLMLQAAAELGFDPACAVVIGDKESDIEFGLRAGAKTVLIAAHPPDPMSRVVPHVIAPNLTEAARAVIAINNSPALVIS
jgi:D-glycero-D-manno-heptose 1,7-bisphosphate phosphatase